MIVLIVDQKLDITDIDSVTTTTSTTMITINTSIVYNYTNDMFTIADLIDGCADFVLGFNVDDIHVGKTDDQK